MEESQEPEASKFVSLECTLLNKIMPRISALTREEPGWGVSPNHATRAGSSHHE